MRIILSLQGRRDGSSIYIKEKEDNSGLTKNDTSGVYTTRPSKTAGVLELFFNNSSNQEYPEPDFIIECYEKFWNVELLDPFHRRKIHQFQSWVFFSLDKLLMEKELKTNIIAVK